MKKTLSIFLIVITAIIISINQPVRYMGAATLQTGVTFTTNQLVQYYDLNNAVNNATISDIVSGDILDGTIAAADLGANSVTSPKILDGTIVTADVASRTLLGSNISTNTITEIELSTNITTRAGLWDLTATRFVANSVTNTAVLGITTGAGAADSGKIPKLNASGIVDSTMLATPAFGITTFTSTNCAITAGGLLTQAHGLGGIPTLIQIRIKNTSTDLEWDSGDELMMPFAVPASGSNTGAAVYSDATNIYVRYGATATVFPILSKDGGAFGAIDITKWQLIIKAWK